MAVFYPTYQLQMIKVKMMKTQPSHYIAVGASKFKLHSPFKQLYESKGYNLFKSSDNIKLKYDIAVLQPQLKDVWLTTNMQTTHVSHQEYDKETTPHIYIFTDGMQGTAPVIVDIIYYYKFKLK